MNNDSSKEEGINKNTKKLKCNGSISQNRSMKKDDTKLLQVTQKTKLFSVQEWDDSARIEAAIITWFFKPCQQ